MKLRSVAIVPLFLLAIGSAALADDIRFYSGSLQGCTVKGIIKASFQAPDTGMGALISNNAKANVSVIPGADAALADLKRQAARLGANRIVVRNIPAAGEVMMSSHGSSYDWQSSEIIAEAYRC